MWYLIGFGKPVFSKPLSLKRSDAISKPFYTSSLRSCFPPTPPLWMPFASVNREMEKQIHTLSQTRTLPLWSNPCSLPKQQLRVEKTGCELEFHGWDSDTKQLTGRGTCFGFQFGGFQSVLGRWGRAAPRLAVKKQRKREGCLSKHSTPALVILSGLKGL